MSIHRGAALGPLGADKALRAVEGGRGSAAGALALTSDVWFEEVSKEATVVSGEVGGSSGVAPPEEAGGGVSSSIYQENLKCSREDLKTSKIGKRAHTQENCWRLRPASAFLERGRNRKSKESACVESEREGVSVCSD